MKGNTLYPVFIKLDEVNTLIVGGGNVALEKLEALLKNNPNANVLLVAPKFKKAIQNIAYNYHNIEIVWKHYQASDLQSKQLVIAATDDPILHELIRADAKARNILVNVADTPNLCDFYLGATVKKGDLKIGISTNGKSPTFAKRLKEVFNASLSEDIEELLEHLHKVRNRLKGDFTSKVKTLNELTKELVKP